MAGKDATIYVEPVQTESVVVALVGTTPLIINRMSEKAKGELLLPKGRKTAAQKQAFLKHIPVEEYRDSVYTLEGPALLAVKATAVKGAMGTAALDLPGTKKAQIKRLAHVKGEYLPVYGVPRLFMEVARCADMNKTPDVRTRAIVPEWVVLATISYVVPLLNATSILNLLAAGGITAGIGDWRPERGGTYGQYTIAKPDDPVVQAIMVSGGREAQQEALDNPVCYDEESARLLTWYVNETARRGK